MDSFICSKCTKIFGYERNLVSHEEKCDGNLSLTAKNKPKKLIKCPDSTCSQVLSEYKLLRKHAEDVHNVKSQDVEHRFQNINEFKKWKEEIETRNVCFYAVRSTATIKDGKRTYYSCHRSGYFNSRSSGKRRVKSQGSNKIDSTCTSSMVVTENCFGVHVAFCSTHFGHGLSLGRCRLTEDERSQLAGKISAGVTFDRIMKDVRDNVRSLYDAKALTTKQQLRNVERDFQLVDGKTHQSDNVSVRLWIEKMSNLSEEENPIVYYNLEDDDLFLIIATDFQLQMLKRFGSEKICVDSTHGTTEYDVYLTTIVVVDEYGNGFPAAFCFSKRKNTEAWVTFFSKLKEKIGIIKTKVFMTDDDPAFYNGWCAVMSEPDHKLLCSWHVDQAWRKQIQAKINGSLEKKTAVYKTLKVLQHEPNIEEFESVLIGVCEEFAKDSGMKEFCHYFQSNYVNRKEQWAYCHRRSCGINTNMYLEAVHKTLKYHYLKGRKNKRMDLCITALLQYIKDKTFERFIKLVKNSYTAKDDRITSSHNAAIKLLDNVLVDHEPSSNSWIINSATEKNVSYTIYKVQDTCNLDNCKVKCRVCDVCSHIFTCECPDYVIRQNICKHIHLAVLTEKKSSNLPLRSPEPIEQDFETETLEKVLVNREEHEENDKEKRNLIDKFMTGVGLIESGEFTKEELESLNKRIDSVLLDLTKRKRKLIDVASNKEPSNKKIEKQWRLIPSKKKNNKPQVRNDTSLGEKFIIKTCFK